MKHVGCYIGEHSGLFKVEHRHVGVEFESRMGDFWTPYTYTLIPINGSEVYYVDVMLKSKEDVPEEGMKVEVSIKPFEKGNTVVYKIKEHK